MTSTTLAKDRLGIPAVLYFILSAMAPTTVAAGVVTTMYAVTRLSAIGAAFVTGALVLAAFAVGYVAMARYITNAGALYAGMVLGVLLCAEVAVLLVLAVAGLADPAAGVPLTSLSAGGLFGHPGVGALLVTALLGYVGFEAADVFSEEARVPRRTVPVAVYSSPSSAPPTPCRRGR
jgi:amino acid transporter